MKKSILIVLLALLACCCEVMAQEATEKQKYLNLFTLQELFPIHSTYDEVRETLDESEFSKVRIQEVKINDKIRLIVDQDNPSESVIYFFIFDSKDKSLNEIAGALTTKNKEFPAEKAYDNLLNFYKLEELEPYQGEELSKHVNSSSKSVTAQDNDTIYVLSLFENDMNGEVYFEIYDKNTWTKNPM